MSHNPRPDDWHRILAKGEALCGWESSMESDPHRLGRHLARCTLLLYSHDAEINAQSRALARQNDLGKTRLQAASTRVNNAIEVLNRATVNKNAVEAKMHNTAMHIKDKITQSEHDRDCILAHMERLKDEGVEPIWAKERPVPKNADQEVPCPAHEDEGELPAATQPLTHESPEASAAASRSQGVIDVPNDTAPQPQGPSGVPQNRPPEVLGSQFGASEPDAQVPLADSSLAELDGKGKRQAQNDVQAPTAKLRRASSTDDLSKAWST